jgi:serine/threonine-protein kinase
MILHADPGAGQTLGRYELLVPIALGGMASVWAARMTGAVEKIVAVKLIRAELCDDVDFEEMFLDEASLVSRIRHPNVAEVLDLGEESGTLYQVMEWVDGEPLNLVLRESKAAGGVPLPVALRIVKEVCAALHAAHELCGADGAHVGLVHRDVSPQNLLVGYDGIVKVVDFGIAKAASNLQTTRVGEVKGKVPYMSPEQGRGDRVDRRSDVFALGIVFYQLVTGKHPFMADVEPATLRRIGDASPAAPPRSLAPALPEDIEAVIVKALAKDRDERFSTMLEMRRALDRVTPPALQISAEGMADYMRQILGPRGERRRAAIREALQIAREGRPAERPPDSRTPRSFSRDDPAVIATTPELERLVSAAAAAAEGAAPEQQGPPIVRAAEPLWRVRAASARRAQLAAFGGVGVSLVIAVIAAVGIAASPSDEGVPPYHLTSFGLSFSRATRVAVAAAQPPPPPAASPAPPATAAPRARSPRQRAPSR